MAPPTGPQLELARNQNISAASARLLAEKGAAAGAARDWQSSDDWRVQLGAGLALRRHGAGGALFAPELVSLLSDPTKEVRGLTADTLHAEAPPQEEDRLRAAMKHEDWRVRCGVLDSMLRGDRERLKGYEHTVAELLRDQQEQVRDSARPVLRQMGREAAEAVAAVLNDDAAGVIQDGQGLLLTLCDGDRALADRLLFKTEDMVIGVDSASDATSSVRRGSAIGGNDSVRRRSRTLEEQISHSANQSPAIRSEPAGGGAQRGTPQQDLHHNLLVEFPDSNVSPLSQDTIDTSRVRFGEAAASAMEAAGDIGSSRSGSMRSGPGIRGSLVAARPSPPRAAGPARPAAASSADQQAREAPLTRRASGRISYSAPSPPAPAGSPEHPGWPGGDDDNEIPELAGQRLSLMLPEAQQAERMSAVAELLSHPDPAVRAAAATLRAGTGMSSSSPSPQVGVGLKPRASLPRVPTPQRDAADAGNGLQEEPDEDEDEDESEEQDESEIAMRLVNTSRTGDRVDRVQSLNRLSHMSASLVAPHAEAITALLDDPDMLVRLSSMELLGMLGPIAGDHVALIAAKMRHTNAQERAVAACAIGNMRAASWSSELAQLLHESDDNVRQEAALALGKLPPDVAGEPAAKQLWHSSDKVRKAARSALLRMCSTFAGGREAALLALQPFIEPALIDGGDDTRQDAMELLEDMGLGSADGGTPACFALAQALSTSDSVEGRMVGIRRLGGLGLEAAPHAARLSSCLADDSEQIRQATLEAFRTLGADAGVAMPAVAELLMHPLLTVRRAAVTVLDPDVAGDAALAFQAACQLSLLQDDSPQVRCGAVERLATLYKHGLVEESQVDEMLRVAHDKHWRLRLACAQALNSFGVELLEAKKVTLDMLCIDEDWRVRKTAKQVLTKFEGLGMQDNAYSRTAKRSVQGNRHDLLNPFERVTRRNSLG